MEKSVVCSVEAEAFVKGLEAFSLRDVGSERWFRQHEQVEKLNMQALLNTADDDGKHEFVKEYLVSHGKMPTLVHELILIEVWKQKIFPILFQLKDFNPKSSFHLYMVLHHEATLINLLETVMFHKDSFEAAEDSALDLVDYCHRKLTLLAAKTLREGPPTYDRHSLTGRNLGSTMQVDSSRINSMYIAHLQQLWQDQSALQSQELQNQNAALEFEISLKALSVLRYITDYVTSVSVIHRLLCIHNMPCVLIQLIHCCPWTRNVGGDLEKYMYCNWQKVPQAHSSKMTKLDGQVWLALYNLVLREECLVKYDFNSYNKNQLFKLRFFLTEVLVDQLPILETLQRFLAHLALRDHAPPKKELIIEQLPEIWNHIMRENDGKWKAIAKRQVQTTFNPSEEDLRLHAKRLAQTYTLDAMDTLDPVKPKCGICGKESKKRCSRCQGEWYCSRECQVKHWPKHKTACQLVAEAKKMELRS